jgi:hypothetical protein
MILTSLAPAERPFGFGPGRLLETGAMTVGRLSGLVVGEMGGVCFAKPGLPAREIHELEALNKRWTGIKRVHLDDCARRAREGVQPRLKERFDGPPGVVVVCFGPERARFLVEAVRLGVINHLIIDDQLEEALLEIVAPELQDFPRRAQRGVRSL